MRRFLDIDREFKMMEYLLNRLTPKIRSLARAAVNRTLGKSATGILEKARSVQNLPVLRCGIVGLGMMGRNHADLLRQHPCFSLAGVAGTRVVQTRVAEEWSCRSFDSAQQMIDSGGLDVLIIATRHWQHAEYCIAGLQAGLHVVCEKPLAVTPTQADAVLCAADESQRLLAVVFQSRFEPALQEAMKLLTTGEIGPIHRCEIVETFWRSGAYYRSSPWRGTWKGEGGGVLLNQAPHVLDRYIWLCGLPASVFGYCDTTLHKIEVEDSASALFRHDGGRHGQFHVSTNECPWISRTTIACDRGCITITNGSMQVARLKHSIREQTAISDRVFGDIEYEIRDLGGAPIDYSNSSLLDRFYDNVALAIAKQEDLLIPGREAARSVELAAAIRLSSATGRAVTLPVSRGEYDSFMADKIGHSVS